MKKLSFLFLVNLPVILFAQNKSLEHIWYVDNSTTNSLKKATITLTLDSISKTTTERICTEIYNLQKDSAYYTTRCCTPIETMGGMLLGSASYLEGKWYIVANSHFILTEPLNKKMIKREFVIQWVSQRKVVLTEI